MDVPISSKSGRDNKTLQKSTFHVVSPGNARTDTIVLNTISQLREISKFKLDSALQRGVQHFKILGYYSAGDLPKPIIYTWNETLHDNDNGGNIIRAKNNINGVFHYELESELNVSSFGIFPDRPQITEQLNRAAEIAAKHNISLNFNDGNYLIDASLKSRKKTTPNNLNKKGFSIPSNSQILTSPKTIFKAIPNGDPNYSIISLHYVENVRINSLRIIGERNSHRGKQGEWGYGLFIVGSSNVQIDNVDVESCWGDGVILSGDGDMAGGISGKSNENIFINKIFSSKNRRQGLTISSGKNIKINYINVHSTHGIAPECGIDFEPDYYYDKLENIQIGEVNSKRNANTGIIFALHALNQKSVPVSITINKIISEGERAFFIGGARSENVKGTINVNQIMSKNAPIAGIEIRSYYNQPDLVFDHVTIENPNRTKREDFYGSGILIYRDIDDIEPIHKKISPRIRINNAKVIDHNSSKFMQYGIYINNRNNEKESIKNVEIGNLNVLGHKQTPLLRF
ncbi:hypothetical protein [Sphingobacterium sp. UBA6645]|uniref:hypothetical protein n=1 Tax=Sphingobacterium sp. UBA6645 TaxID=1947511 RepID=UPI0025FC55C2|nr:hypothetical protein [Sphingobacterium sp. UBA6645]